MPKAPQLPPAPNQYSREYQDKLLRSLALYFNQLDNPTLLQGVFANFSYVRDNLIVRGLTPTDELDGAVLAAAGTITLLSTDSFAASGDAYILDGNISDKIKYTGKTATTLTGVTGIVNGHDSGKIVVASARVGDIFADPSNEYALKIIP